MGFATPSFVSNIAYELYVDTVRKKMTVLKLRKNFLKILSMHGQGNEILSRVINLFIDSLVYCIPVYFLFVEF